MKRGGGGEGTQGERGRGGAILCEALHCREGEGGGGGVVDEGDSDEEEVVCNAVGMTVMEREWR